MLHGDGTVFSSRIPRPASVEPDRHAGAREAPGEGSPPAFIFQCFPSNCRCTTVMPFTFQPSGYL